MAYTINKTDGSIFAVVADGTINTDSSQIVVGKNYAGYGEFLGENFIRLLENAANTTQPSNPLQGQLWFDTATTVLKVWSGATFKNLGAASSDVTAPTNPVIGDLWYDPTNKQLFVYDPGDGTQQNPAQWILVGPSFTAGTGVSGAIVDVITDSIGNDHTVVKLYVNDEIIGIISKDKTFTPGTGIPGFTTVAPGIQLTTITIDGDQRLFVGTAQTALSLTDTNGNEVDTDNFVRKDKPSTYEEIAGGLWVKGATEGIKSGPTGEFKVSTINSDVFLENSAVGKDMVFRLVPAGESALVSIMAINGTTGQVTVKYPMDDSLHPVSQDSVITKDYVDKTVLDNIQGFDGAILSDGTITMDQPLRPTNNNSISLGTAAQQYTTVYAAEFAGTSVKAKYADLAERFETDTAMSPGTVVELGGEKEITKAMEEFSDNVFGVISTSAAYLMNSEAGEDETHPAVAMNGRVPVRVIGTVNKGDRLVSAGNGLAQSATSSNITPFNVIGRALHSKYTKGEGVVEAIVRIN